MSLELGMLVDCRRLSFCWLLWGNAGSSLVSS